MTESAGASEPPLEEIRKICFEGGLFYTDHAVRAMLSRQIADTDVQEAILSGEIIKSYPQDKYSPSYLILGRASSGRVLHVLCSQPPRVRVITTYEPDPAEWIDNRTRKGKDEL
jgi:hypothetical protein